MLSAAVSGSVSDSTKVTPTLVPASFKYKIRFQDGNESSIVTLSNGATSSDIDVIGTGPSDSVQSIVLKDPANARPQNTPDVGLTLTIAGQASAPGGRSTSNIYYVFPANNIHHIGNEVDFPRIGEIGEGSWSNYTLWHPSFFEATGLDQSQTIGVFDVGHHLSEGQPESAWASAPGFYRKIVGDGSVTVDQAADIGINNDLLFEGIIAEANGTLEHEQNSLVVFDSNTGRYGFSSIDFSVVMRLI